MWVAAPLEALDTCQAPHPLTEAADARSTALAPEPNMSGMEHPPMAGAACALRNNDQQQCDTAGAAASAAL